MIANPEVDVNVNVSKNLLNVSNVPFYVYRPYNFKFHVCKFVSYLFLLFWCYHNCNLDVETVGMVNVCVSNVFICCSRVLWVLCDMFSWNFIKHSIFCVFIFSWSCSGTGIKNTEQNNTSFQINGSIYF